jgi:hypothetical protein
LLAGDALRVTPKGHPLAVTGTVITNLKGVDMKYQVVINTTARPVPKFHLVDNDTIENSTVCGVYLGGKGTPESGWYWGQDVPDGHVHEATNCWNCLHSADPDGWIKAKYAEARRAWLASTVPPDPDPETQEMAEAMWEMYKDHDPTTN